MKTTLILFLIVSLNCNIIDISICLLKSDELRTILIDILTAINEKNWMKIVSTALLKFEEVKSIIINCKEPKPEPEPEPDPEPKEDICFEKCKDEVDYHDREECYKDCYFGH